MHQRVHPHVVRIGLSGEEIRVFFHPPFAYRFSSHPTPGVRSRWTPRLNEFKGLLAVSVFYQGGP